MTMNLSEAVSVLNQAQTVVLVTHVFPDGDAIGTQLGIANALIALGKQVTVAVDGGVPDFLRFLPGQEIILPALTTGQWDLAISVDSSDAERSGNCGAFAFAHSRTVINLDHHATNTLFGDVHLVNPSAVSATEIAGQWLAEIGITWTPAVCVPLLTGLVTDTLGFRTSNVTAHTLSIAQHLMQHGASLAEITARTLDSKPYATLKLWKQVFSTILLEDGVICAQVTRADLAAAYGQLDETNASDGGLSSLLIQTNEAMIAVVFRETSDQRVELSCRAKLGFDVSGVALSIGGGGHKQAAGATVDGTLPEVMARVIPLLKEAVRQGTQTIA